MLAPVKPYRRFIILSSPRSGTHMLRTALKNHPNIAARTEVFNPDFLHDRPFGPQTPAKEILNKHIYRDLPAKIQMLGFIIHRSGAPFGNWPDLWEMLQDDKDIYVISLRRRNLLKRYLSYQVMRTFKGSPPKPLTFDPEALKKDFICQQKEVDAFDERFAGHPLIKVYYEDLCTDYHRTMKKIQRFLKVKPQKLWPGIKGKPKRKLREAIANFDELQAYFAQTKWATFFNEEEVIHISHPGKKRPFFGIKHPYLDRLADSPAIWPYKHIRFRHKKSWTGLIMMLTKYQLRQLYQRLVKSKSRFYKDLPNTGIVFYSQYLEELLIRSFFQDRRNGVFLDIGCAWPHQLNNTCYLEKHLGWSGIAVDAFPACQEEWEKHRPNTQLLTFIITDHYGTVEKFYEAGGIGSTKEERLFLNKVIRGNEVLVPTMTLTKLLDDQGIKKIDFLSIDIEESEAKALAGFDIERFQPELVCIERAYLDEDEILNYFEKHHYKLLREYMARDKSNWYFVPK